MLVSPAYAQAAAPPGAGFDLMAFLPLILIFVVFYFLLIRPQQKKMRDHKSMLDALRRGDRIVTGGGVVGVVAKVGADDEVMVEIAEGVRVKVMKPTIQAVLAKTEPAKGGGGGKAAEAAPAANQDGAPGVAGALGKMFGRK